MVSTGRPFSRGTHFTATAVVVDILLALSPVVMLSHPVQCLEPVYTRTNQLRLNLFGMGLEVFIRVAIKQD